MLADEDHGQRVSTALPPRGFRMSATMQERLSQLEQRLAQLERERSSMREPLAAERRKPSGWARWRPLGGVGVAAVLVGIGLLAAPTSEAKVKAPAAHSVQAPFHVLDKAGK